MFDPVAELLVGVKELAAEDRAGWPGSARTDRLNGLLAVRERFEVEIIRAVAGWDAAQAWALDGGLTPVSWLMARFPLTRTDARTLVDLAGVYARYPQIAAAVDGAEITLVHLRLLARAEKSRVEPFAICVDALLEAARRMATLDEFAGFIAEWIDAVDNREPPDDSKRGWFARKGFGGLASGELMSSDENLALIRSALDTHDTPDAWDCPEGPRTKAQRDHDSLMDIIRLYLADKLNGDADPAGGADITLDSRTAAELLADPDHQLDPDTLDTPDPLDELLAPYRPPGDHHSCGHDHQNSDERVCELTTGERATLAFAAVLLCTGWARRILRDPATGTIMDMGRRTRLFTRTQRRALVYRDRGCVFPGCDRPAKFCDAHHIKPWEQGGLTDLINGVLTCRRHHLLLHNGWDLTRNPTTGVVTVTSPNGRTFTRQPPNSRHPGRCTFDQPPTDQPPTDREPTRC